MSVSVIIPAYNEALTITNCLNSLFNQTLKVLEIIVVDDGSTDTTVDKVTKLQKTLPKIKLIKQSHQGPAQARNLGANQAEGEILVFVDADMEFDQGFLKQLTLPLMNRLAVGSWSGNEWVKNWQNVWARCWNYNQNRPDAKMVSDQKGQKKVFRSILKSEFIRVNGFDSIGYTDDWSLGSKLGVEPKITTAKFYHHNPNTLLTVFRQARWIGKREYKLGKIGILITVFKANAGFSIIIGLLKSFRFLFPPFIIFKLVYDLGIMLGALEKLCFGSYY
ncbi:MAG: glycosyltransferase family 2 protein [Candidatus Beckwithbacteria bacterium]